MNSGGKLCNQQYGQLVLSAQEEQKFYVKVFAGVIFMEVGFVYLRTKFIVIFSVAILYFLSISKHNFMQCHEDFYIHANISITDKNRAYCVILWSLLFCQFSLQKDIDVSVCDSVIKMKWPMISQCSS